MPGEQGLCLLPPALPALSTILSILLALSTAFRLPALATAASALLALSTAPARPDYRPTVLESVYVRARIFPRPQRFLELLGVVGSGGARRCPRKRTRCRWLKCDPPQALKRHLCPLVRLVCVDNLALGRLGRWPSPTPRAPGGRRNAPALQRRC